MTLRSRIIRLASSNAELRPHLLRILADDKSDIQWAIREVQKAKNTDDLWGVVEVLEARRGGPAITDVYGDINREVERIRRGDATSGGDLLKALKNAVKKAG